MISQNIASSADNYVTERRLRRLAQLLGRDPFDFLRQISTAKYEKEVLEFTRELSPVSDRSRFFAATGAASSSRLATTSPEGAAGMGLRESWRVRRMSTEDTLGLFVYSMLETTAGKRGYIKLASIEWGNKASVLSRSRASYSFPSSFVPRRIQVVEGGLYSSEGPRIKRPARAGLHILEKTDRFIRASILPRLQGDIAKLVARRLEEV